MMQRVGSEHPNTAVDYQGNILSSCLQLKGDQLIMVITKLNYPPCLNILPLIEHPYISLNLPLKHILSQLSPQHIPPGSHQTISVVFRSFPLRAQYDVFLVLGVNLAVVHKVPSYLLLLKRGWWLDSLRLRHHWWLLKTPRTHWCCLKWVGSAWHVGVFLGMSKFGEEIVWNGSEILLVGSGLMG